MGSVEYGGAEAPGNVNNGDDAPGNVNNGDDDDGVNETEETEYELQKEDLYDIIGTLKEKVKEHVNARVQILVQNRELQEEVKRFTDMTTSVSGAKEYKDAMKKRKAYEDILKPVNDGDIRIRKEIGDTDYDNYRVARRKRNAFFLGQDCKRRFTTCRLLHSFAEEGMRIWEMSIILLETLQPTSRTDVIWHFYSE